MSYKLGVPKHFSILTGKHLCQNHFLSCNFIKKDILQNGFSFEFCKIFEKPFLQNTSGWLVLFYKNLLALYFAIIRSWQLSSSDKPLVAKQNSSIYLKDFTNLDFFFHFFHFLFIFCDKSLFTLSVTQSACCFLSSQPYSWLGDTWTEWFWPILKI